MFEVVGESVRHPRTVSPASSSSTTSVATAFEVASPNECAVLFRSSDKQTLDARLCKLSDELCGPDAVAWNSCVCDCSFLSDWFMGVCLRLCRFTPAGRWPFRRDAPYRRWPHYCDATTLSAFMHALVTNNCTVMLVLFCCPVSLWFARQVRLSRTAFPKHLKFG